jgi:hypothetical protein
MARPRRYLGDRARVPDRRPPRRRCCRSGLAGVRPGPRALDDRRGARCRRGIRVRGRMACATTRTGGGTARLLLRASGAGDSGTQPGHGRDLPDARADRCRTRTLDQAGAVPVWVDLHGQRLLAALAGVEPDEPAGALPLRSLWQALSDRDARDVAKRRDGHRVRAAVHVPRRTIDRIAPSQAPTAAGNTQARPGGSIGRRCQHAAPSQPRCSGTGYRPCPAHLARPRRRHRGPRSGGATGAGGIDRPVWRVGSAARSSSLHGIGLAHAGTLRGAWIAALCSVLLDNLPAAVLLSSAHVAHPAGLLLGLAIGPNLAITGSLSALLWWRAASAAGARPSALRFSRHGLVLAPLAIGCALAMGALFGASP